MGFLKYNSDELMKFSISPLADSGELPIETQLTLQELSLHKPAVSKMVHTARGRRAGIRCKQHYISEKHKPKSGVDFSNLINIVHQVNCFSEKNVKRRLNAHSVKTKPFY